MRSSAGSSACSPIGWSWSRVNSSSSSGDTHGDEIREAEFLERRIRRRQLSLAAVNQDEVWKRTAVFQHRPIASTHDFVHRGEVVLMRPAEPSVGSGMCAIASALLRSVGAGTTSETDSASSACPSSSVADASAAAGVATELARHFRARETSDTRRLHASIDADHHGRHGLAALEGRDVEALDAPRQRSAAQALLQRRERVVLRSRPVLNRDR